LRASWVAAGRSRAGGLCCDGKEGTGRQGLGLRKKAV